MLHRLLLHEQLTGLEAERRPEDYFRWCFGGGDVSVPGPSEEERALQAQQTEILREQLSIIREQADVQDVVAELIFQNAGIELVRDPETGRVIGSEQLPQTPAQERQQTIEELFQERTLSALRGELPVNPAVERDLQQRRDVVTEQLRRQLGPGFETSTPGIESLRSLFESEEQIREGARRGDLTLAEQFQLAQSEQNFARQQDFLNNALVAGNLPFQTVAALNSPISGFGNIQSRMQSDRFAQAQAAAAAAQADATSMAGLFQGIGTIGGAVLGAGLVPGGFLR